MKRFLQRSGVILAAMSALPAALPAAAWSADQDAAFFDKAEGSWTGPGEIIAGKYKGTKFICTLNGSASAVTAGMTLDGNCRVGVFNQKMKATVERAGNGYRGKFLDGAAGDGMDIVSGDVVGQDKAVFGIDRKKLNGAMIARLASQDTMVVTVSVKVEDKMIPVLGMNLKRIDGVQVGSIDQ